MSPGSSLNFCAQSGATWRSEISNEPISVVPCKNPDAHQPCLKKKQNMWSQNIARRWTDQYPFNKKFPRILWRWISSILSLPFYCALREACKQLVGMGWSWHQLWWSFSTRWNREPPCQSLSRRICFFFCFGFNVPSDTFTVKLRWKFLARKCSHKHCNIEVVAC